MTVGTILTTDEAREILRRAYFESNKAKGYIDEDEEFNEDTEDDGWGEFSWRFRKPFSFDAHTVTTVEDFGGEGQGETRYVVFDIDGQLFRKDGYYASHYGTDWDGDWREVQAVQRQVTFYE